MKKGTSFMLAFVFMSFAIISCKKTSIDEYAPINKAIKEKTAGNDIAGREGMEEICTPTNVSLIAGQHINAGSVTVTNDANYIYVTYTTTGSWVITQTHLYVGGCSLIPVNNSGNPRIGQFPYSGTHANLTTYTYRLPITALNGCGCIAAHAVVKKLNGSGQVIQTETAWGNGTQITPGGSWAMKFSYCLCTMP